jgi:uncharacterized protein YfiM (DUF2279 family)
MPKKVTATAKKQSNTVCTYVVAVTIGFGLFGTINHTKAEIRSDAWTGQDKALHFMVSMPLGMMGAKLVSDGQSPAEQFFYGALLGSLPGLMKETRDIHHRGSTASYKDMTYNILGASLGAFVSDCCTIKPIGTKDRLDGIIFEYKVNF